MKNADKLAGLLRKAIPYLREAGEQYLDDGSNEPMELARDADAALAEHDAQLAHQAEPMPRIIGYVRRAPFHTRDIWQECSKDEHDLILANGYWHDPKNDFNWPSITRAIYDAQPAQAAQPIQDMLDAGDPDWRKKLRPNLTGDEAMWFAVRDIAEERRMLANEVATLRAQAAQPVGVPDVAVGPVRMPIQEVIRVMRNHAGQLDVVQHFRDSSCSAGKPSRDDAERANLLRTGADALERIAAPQPPAQPNADAFDFERHLLRQREWSGRTFGPGARSQGCVDHIRKELREIEANPGDLEEWIDVAILALDGTWRSGAQPTDIVAALVAKQTKNERRKWPDWRTADPNHAIEHDRSEDDPMSADSSDRRWEDFER